MKEKELETIMTTLEKIVRDGYNFGTDRRIGKTISALQKYTRYNADIDDEDIGKKANKLLDKILDLGGKISEVSLNYVDANKPYMKVLFDSIRRSKSLIEREERKRIKEKVYESIQELCAFMQETLEKTELLDILWVKEERALRELGLRNFITEEEKEIYKKELFSERSVKNMTSFSDEIRMQALLLFWVNKLAKLMEDCTLGYMIEKSTKKLNPEGKKDLRDVDEKEKTIALLRVDFIKKFFRYSEKRLGRDYAMTSDEEFERYLSTAGVNFYMPDFLRYLVYERDGEASSTELKEYFEQLPQTRAYYENLPEDYREVVDDMERRYSLLFAEESAGTDLAFVYDAFVLSQIEEVQKSIYDLKTELTSVVLFSLLLEKEMNPTPLFKVWGVNYDKRAHEESETANVFYLELPGFIHPLMVHVEDMVIEGAESMEIEIPEYHGIFENANRNQLESYLAAPVLFRLNARQQKVLKDTKKVLKADVTKRKKEIEKMPENFEKTKAKKVWERECKYFRVLEYMEAMAKDKPRSVEKD